MRLASLVFAFFATAWGSTFVVACRHSPEALPPCTEPEPLTVALQTSTRLNPDENGRSLPTVFRVYQLKDAEALEMARLDDLVERDQQLLGAALLSVQEFTIHPGQTKELSLPRETGAVHWAVVGLFRKPAGLSWRASGRLPAPNPGHCHGAGGPVFRLEAEDNRVELSH